MRIVAHLRGKAQFALVHLRRPVPLKERAFSLGNMARQLLLIRHASPGASYAGRYLGKSDVPVADWPAQRLAALVQDRNPARCFCSPMLRARQTAQRIAGQLPVEIDEDLREVDFGDWEGRTFEQIAASDPAGVNRWAEFSDDFAFPGGESIGSFLNRVGRVASRLAAEPSDRLLVVTHGGVIRAMICRLLGLHPSQYVLFNVRYATCTTIDLFDGKGVLSGLNMEGI